MRVGLGRAVVEAALYGRAAGLPGGLDSDGSRDAGRIRQERAQEPHCAQADPVEDAALGNGEPDQVPDRRRGS